MIQIVQTNDLTPEQLADVRQLENQIFQQEKLENRAWLSNEINFDLALPCFFLGYEENKLAAFLTTFMPTREEAEITAFTRADCRNRGYFGKLCQSAVDVCRENGIPKLLFAVERKSVTGQRVLRKLEKSTLSHSEYRMEFSSQARYDSKRLSFMPVELESEAAYRDIVKAALGRDELDSYVDSTLRNPHRSAFVAYCGEVPVGVFHLNTADSAAVIYGVGVDPAYRGLGYGKELMEFALWQGRKHKATVELDVDSSNEAAFHIYQKLGFEITFQVDYFSVEI